MKKVVRKLSGSSGYLGVVSNTVLILILLVVISLGLASIGIYLKLSSVQSIFSNSDFNSVSAAVQPDVPLGTQGQASINVLPSARDTSGLSTESKSFASQLVNQTGDD